MQQFSLTLLFLFIFNNSYSQRLDSTLITLLDSIHQGDQNYRRQIRSVENEFGRNSTESKNLWNIIEERDSINLITVKEILDNRGWLGQDVVGWQGNQTLFLVIQHADFETQKTYLPMMRAALKQGNASPDHLALLEDRVALRSKKKQIYGSQVGLDKEGNYYVLPLINPRQVDKRRAKMGLGVLADYIDFYELKWDVPSYKKKLRELKKDK